MAELKDTIKSDDWKKEKHVPVIECPASVKAGEVFEVRVSVGKEVDHPNTTEHHIRYISLFFQADQEKAPLQIGRVEFSAHGESVKGANQGPAYTHHGATMKMKTSQPGTLMAVAFCNIHGLWESSKAVAIG